MVVATDENTKVKNLKYLKIQVPMVILIANLC